MLGQHVRTVETKYCLWAVLHLCIYVGKDNYFSLKTSRIYDLIARATLRVYRNTEILTLEMRIGSLPG